MAIDPVSINTALDQQSKTTATQQQLATDFDDFLTLLTTQLQHQDPLSPMDTNEFTNQLVAFAGVEQQINTNQKLDSLVAMSLGNSFSNSLNYVGMDVSYLSSEMNFDGSQPVTINYSLEKQALSSKISIYDEDGALVYTAEASKSPGKSEFTWDGTTKNGDKAPAGTYEVKIDALDADGKAINSTTVVSGRVRGLETQNGLIYVLVGDRAVSVANILNATVPPAETPAEEEQA